MLTPDSSSTAFSYISFLSERGDWETGRLGFSKKAVVEARREGGARGQEEMIPMIPCDPAH